MPIETDQTSCKLFRLHVHLRCNGLNITFKEVSVNHIRTIGKLPENVGTLITAFSGWSDAGDAATGAIRYLIRARKAKLIAEYEPEDFFDFTQNRPIVKVGNQGIRSLSWPKNEFYFSESSEGNIPLLLFVGTEPNLKWGTFSNSFLDIAELCGVKQIITFGALLNAVPHTRKAQVNGSSTSKQTLEIMERMGIVSGGTYEGPTGISSAIIQIAKDRGIDHTGFWGHVPHYIQTNPNPVVMESILDKLRSVVGISVDLKELEGESAAFIERCEEAIKDDPSIRDYVERLEKYFDDIIIEEDLEIFSQPELGSPQNTHGPSDFPTTEDLVEDLENFLRKRRNAD